MSEEVAPANKKGFAHTIGELLVGLLVAYFIGEAMVLFFWGEQAKFPRRVVEAPWGLRYNAPGADYRHKSADVKVQFEINEQGMRAQTDYAYEKPEGVVRVVSLGDSFAMGYEVELDETYASVVERNMQEAGYDAQVLNAGVSGFSTAEAYLYLKRELIRYEPDLVVFGFYFNDYTDNVRTSLFTVGDDGSLQVKNDRYVPLGKIGNMLNDNPVFNFLSAYSNSFVLVKENLTLYVKRLLLSKNVGEERKAAEREIAVTPADGKEQYAVNPYSKQLMLAILGELYAFCNERDIPLLVLSIPSGGIPATDVMPDRPLQDTFPVEFDTNVSGITLLNAADLLQPYYGKQELVHQRSHMHWTPFAHGVVGESMSELILDRGLLER